MAHAKKAGETSRLSAPERRAGQAARRGSDLVAVMAHARLICAVAAVMVPLHAVVMTAHHAMAFHAVMAPRAVAAVMGDGFGLDGGIGMHGGARGVERSGLGRDGGAKNGHGRDSGSE
jgi:hypothetical protein